MPYGRYRRFGLRRRNRGSRTMRTSTSRIARFGRRAPRRRTIRRGHFRAMKQYLRAAEAKTMTVGLPTDPTTVPPPMSTGVATPGSTQWPSILGESVKVRAYHVISPFAVQDASETTATVEDIFSESTAQTAQSYPFVNGRYLTWRSVQFRFSFFNTSTDFPICVHMAWVRPRLARSPIIDYIMPPAGASVANPQVYGIQPQGPWLPGVYPSGLTGPWIDALRSREIWTIPLNDYTDHTLRLDRRVFKVKWTTSFVLAAATTGTDGTVPGVAGRPPHKLVHFRRFYPSGWTIDYKDGIYDNNALKISTKSRPPSMLIWWHPVTPLDPAGGNNQLNMTVTMRTTYSDPN